MARDQAGSMKEFAINMLKRQVVYESLWALDDVSFEIETGRSVWRRRSQRCRQEHADEGPRRCPCPRRAGESWYAGWSRQ